MAHTGIVKWFDRSKGFGFVTPNGGGDDVFLHRLNLPSDSGAPILDEGDVISYNLGTHKDRPTAVDVVMPEGKPHRRRGRGKKAAESWVGKEQLSAFYRANQVDVALAIEAIKGKLRTSGGALCLDLEWDSHSPQDLPLSLVQVAVESEIHVLDAVTVPDLLRMPSGGENLAEHIQSTETLKVMHAAIRDKEVLWKRGVSVKRLFDTQVAHGLLTGVWGASLQTVVEHWLDVKIDKGGNRVKDFMKKNHEWVKRPLPDFIIQYAADDVVHLPALYRAMHAAAAGRGLVFDIFAGSADESVARQLQRAQAVEVPRPPDAEPSPPTNVQGTAIAFGQQLMVDAELRRACEAGGKPGFIERFEEWKAREYLAGRPRIGGGNAVLSYLMLSNYAVRKALGLPRVKYKAGVLRINADSISSAAAAAAAAEFVESNRAQIEADKGGISVSPVAFDEVVGVGGDATRRVVIKNVGKLTCTLQSAKMLRGSGMAAFELSNRLDNLVLPAGSQVAFTVDARPTVVGVTRQILSLNFLKSEAARSFSIGRYLEVRCGDAAMLDLLKPAAPYVRPKQKRSGVPRHLLNVVAAPNKGGGGKRPDGPKLEFYDIFNTQWHRMLNGPAEGRAKAEDLLHRGAQRMVQLRAEAALQELGVVELKRQLASLSIDSSACLEKSELQDLLRPHFRHGESDTATYREYLGGHFYAVTRLGEMDLASRRGGPVTAGAFSQGRGPLRGAAACGGGAAARRPGKLRLCRRARDRPHAARRSALASGARPGGEAAERAQG